MTKRSLSFNDKDITLELIENNDVTELYSLVMEHKSYLLKWLSWPAQCQQPKDMLAMVAAMQTSLAKGKTMDFVIRYQGSIVGMISYNDINDSLKKVEIGYWLVESFQGKGIIHQACQLLIDYAFDTWQMEKIQMSVASHNERSIKVCYRLGMIKEGQISYAENLHGRIVHHDMFALFKTSLSDNKKTY